MRRLILASLLILPLAAHAQTTIEVSSAWARATTPHAQSGGIFLTLTDHGTADRLVSVSTPVAETAELHETIDDHGIMRMRGAPGLALPPNGTVTLKPGGLHIMLFGLKRALARGERFPVDLVFEHAPSVRVMVVVGGAGDSGP